MFQIIFVYILRCYAQNQFLNSLFQFGFSLEDFTFRHHFKFLFGLIIFDTHYFNYDVTIDRVAVVDVGFVTSGSQ